MARVKLSPVITSINGKLGNAVFQGGKSGIILREHVIPRNANTQLQRKARGLLNSVKSEWQGLGTAGRNSWIAFASFVQKKQKHNNTKSLSPYELYIQSGYLHNQGDYTSAFITSLETAAVVSFFTDIQTLTSVLFIIYVEITVLTGDVITSIYLSRPYRQSAAIPKSSLRYVATTAINGDSLDVTDKYLELFGTLPVSGQKILVKRIAFLEFSGWVSNEFIEEIIIS